MKKLLLLSLSIIYCFQLCAQTEKGMWLMNGKVFSSSSLSTNDRTNEENHFFFVQSEIGFFLNKKNLIGTKLSFQLNDNKEINLFTQELEKNLDYSSELSSFYRFYPLPNKRLGFFSEMQFSLLGDSRNISGFYKQFRAQIGAGAYFFLRRNLAFEMSFSKPFYQTTGLNSRPSLIANFSLIRNFKRPVKTQLPKLEDTYLFVRNFYYGLGIQRSFNQSSLNQFPSPNSGLQFSINTGFFLSSHWLIDLQYSLQDFNLGTPSNIFTDFRLESAFFIPLNNKGTYLRPSATLRLENKGRISSRNSDLLGFRKLAYIGNLEITQFFGDQVIIGGGGSMVFTTFGPKVEHFLFNANLRLTYFVTKDFAIEYKGAYYINDSLNNRTGDDLILDLTNVNAELKIRHFFFQE